jgi:hypothetical protein
VCVDSLSEYSGSRGRGPSARLKSPRPFKAGRLFRVFQQPGKDSLYLLRSALGCLPRRHLRDHCHYYSALWFRPFSDLLWRPKPLPGMGSQNQASHFGDWSSGGEFVFANERT